MNQPRVGIAVERRRDLEFRDGGGTFRRRRVAKPVDVEGVRWIVAVAATGCEFAVADDLEATGFRAYAPHLVRRIRGRLIGGKREYRERDYPVFGRYVFVGQPAGLMLAKASHSRLVDILRDGLGYAAMSPRAVAAINALHLAGAWDECAKVAPDWLRRGASVRVTGGPMEGFCGIVEAVPSALRATVRVGLARLKVRMDAGLLEPQRLDMAKADAL